MEGSKIPKQLPVWQSFRRATSDAEIFHTVSHYTSWPTVRITKHFLLLFFPFIIPVHLESANGITVSREALAEWRAQYGCTPHATWQIMRIIHFIKEDCLHTEHGINQNHKQLEASPTPAHPLGSLLSVE